MRETKTRKLPRTLTIYYCRVALSGTDAHLFLHQAFSVVFDKAIDRSEPAEEVKGRVINLIDCITYSVYGYTSRGLFEKDKLTFLTLMTTQVRCCSSCRIKNGITIN